MVGGPPPPPPKYGYGAYAKSHRGQLSGSALERDALLRAAHLLEKARTHPEDPGALAEALRFNTELWTIFQADLADRRNPLAPALKQELLSLSVFMDTSTAELLGGFDNATIAAMVDVNLALAGGEDH